MLFWKKRSLAKRLKEAFPREYGSAVERVCGLISIRSAAYSGILYSRQSTEWKLLSGESISIPYRIYLPGIDKMKMQLLSPTELMIYNCIYSRSCDGYVREKSIKALLNGQTPDWAIPYVIKVSDEYVKEILNTVYESLKGKDTAKYKEICLLNFDFIRRAHSRMISYWNEYYRYEYRGELIEHPYKEYVGRMLYLECFGYRKSGQKTINL